MGKCYYYNDHMHVYISNSREDSVIFSKRQGYQVTMKKVAQLQDKIEGWEVSTGVDICAFAGMKFLLQ